MSIQHGSHLLPSREPDRCDTVMRWVAASTVVLFLLLGAAIGYMFE